MTAPDTLTALREKVAEARLVCYTYDYEDDPDAFLDALLAAHRELVVAECREKVEQADWHFHEAYYNGAQDKLMYRADALAALSHPTEETNG